MVEIGFEALRAMRLSLIVPFYLWILVSLEVYIRASLAERRGRRELRALRRRSGARLVPNWPKFPVWSFLGMLASMGLAVLVFPTASVPPEEEDGATIWVDSTYPAKNLTATIELPGWQFWRGAEEVILRIDMDVAPDDRAQVHIGSSARSGDLIVWCYTYGDEKVALGGPVWPYSQEAVLDFGTGDLGFCGLRLSRIRNTVGPLTNMTVPGLRAILKEPAAESTACAKLRVQSATEWSKSQENCSGREAQADGSQWADAGVSALHEYIVSPAASQTESFRSILFGIAAGLAGGFLGVLITYMDGRRNAARDGLLRRSGQRPTPIPRMSSTRLPRGRRYW